MPHLSPDLQGVIRAAYGALMLLTLLWAWPHRRRFFVSERWGGYAESHPSVDWLQNPIGLTMAYLIWVTAGGALLMGVAVVPAALVNLCFCHYFFIAMRWRGLLRGMGAPGFMAYWLGLVVCLLEFTARHAPDLHALALLVAQVDLALIFASAGIYKATDGYARNEGMDYGMANPQWGYWWRWCRRWPPRHIGLAALNHLAWSVEVIFAALMLIPATRPAGGLMLSASFLFIALQIRLGWLAEIVVLCGLLYIPAGHVIDLWVAGVMPAGITDVSPAPAWLGDVLRYTLWGYLIATPLAHAGLYLNYYGRRRLTEPLQRLLEAYTNFFGIIIWRVFSVDHLNFFVRIHHQRRGTNERVLISRYGSWRAIRFCHVAESIVICTIFTTLKYYASQPALFEARLRRYARTVPCPPDAVLVFEYVAVRKSLKEFAHVPVQEYVFDPADASIHLTVLDAGFDPRRSAEGSVVHEGTVPGSYAPVSR